MSPAAARAVRGAALLLLVAGLITTAAVPSLLPIGSAAASASLELRLNPNTANSAELQLLPRIGPKLAEAIIAFRDASPSQPAFRTLPDLDAVRGIGPLTLERLAPYLDFPPQPSPDARAPAIP